MNKEYKIRPEKEKDFAEIYDLIKVAFSTAKVKDGDEQDFATNLREQGNYIPELALVAEVNNKLIAHIMLTKTYITTPNGMTEALLLAPLSVLSDYRSQGVGSMLVYENLKRAKAMGYKSVFLCGDPMYYNRFGFEKTVSFGIENINGLPEQYSMVHELEPEALSKVAGTIDFMDNRIQLTTSRLRIIPLDAKQFQLLLSDKEKMEQELGLTPSNIQLDAHTQQAMEGLYQELLKNEDRYFWYTNWQIILESENKAIASACFMNAPDKNGIVEIGYGTDIDYRNKGYMIEAVHAIIQWAWKQPKVKCIIAETEKDNYASQRVLEQCGMQQYEKKEFNLLWKLNKNHI